MSKGRLPFLTIMLTLCGCLSSSAATMQWTALEILRKSPQIKQAAFLPQRLSAEADAAGNLPDPEIEGEILFGPSADNNRWGAGVSWSLDWPGVYALRRQEARSRATAAETAAYAAVADKIVEVETLLMDYILQQQQLALLQQIKTTNDSIARTAQNAGHNGELTRLDLNKINIENATLLSEISTLNDQRQQTITALNVFYGGDCSALLENMDCVFPEFDIPDESQLADAVNGSTYMKNVMAELQASNDALRLTGRERLPGLSIGYRHAYEDNTHFNGATIGLSIPVFSGRKKKAAAELALSEAEFNASATQTSLTTQAEGTIRRLKNLRQQIDALSPLVADSNNFDTLDKAYKNRVITLLEYLNERNYFIRAQQNLLDLRHAAAVTRISLEPLFPYK